MNVVILAAGMGTRTKEISPSKPMMMFNGIPLVKHLIDKYIKYPIYITIRHDDMYLESYLLTLIEIGYGKICINLEHEQSDGPMISLKKTLETFPELLNASVLVTVSDGLYTVPESIIEGRDEWVLVSPIIDDSYCKLSISRGMICEPSDVSYSASWTGVMKMKDVNLLSTSPHKNFDYLLNSRPWPIVNCSDWIDLGTSALYNKHYNDVFDFSKKNNSTEIISNTVVKVFKSRIDAHNLYDILTTNEYIKSNNEHKISGVKLRGNVISYDYVEGCEFYNLKNSYKHLLELLNHFWDNLWKCDGTAINFVPFYREKTLNRLSEYGVKNALIDFDWSQLEDGLLANIHGDLQYSNIIGHTLIDWRTDFYPLDVSNGGDIYYDLAKLMTGMIIDFSAARTGNFDHVENFEEHIRIFKKFHAEKSLNWHKTKILCAITLISIAPLHKTPFNAFAYNSGLRLLNNINIYD